MDLHGSTRTRYSHGIRRHLATPHSGGLIPKTTLINGKASAFCCRLLHAPIACSFFFLNILEKYLSAARTGNIAVCGARAVSGNADREGLISPIELSKFSNRLLASGRP